MASCCRGTASGSGTSDLIFRAVLYGFSGWHGLLVGKSSDTNAAIGRRPVVGDFDDVTTGLLVDGSDVAAAVVVVGAVRIVVVTAVVDVETTMTADLVSGVATRVGLSTDIVQLELVATVVDVAVVMTSIAVVGATSASDVALGLDGAVEVDRVSSSEMTTASWKSNFISGRVGVMVAGVVTVCERAANSSAV